MKIRIDFTSNEKMALLVATEAPVDKDETTISSGKFGRFEYNKNDNFVELDFKESFITSIANVIGSAVGMIKSLMHTCTMFTDMWFDECKIEYPGRKEESTEADESQNA